MMRLLALFALAAAVAATAPTGSNDCGKPCDVMMVIDRSGSIKKFGSGGVSGGDREKDFVIDLLGMLDNHYKDLYAGFVSYNRKVYNKYATLSGDIDAVRRGLETGLPGTGGVTHTHEAIKSGDQFLTSSGRKNVACKRMYVITDGVTNPKSYAKATKQAAANAQKKGYKLIAIGVGDGIMGNKVAEAEMRAIASDPDSENFIEATDFKAAFDKLHAKDVCLPTTSPCLGTPPVHGGSGTWTCTLPTPGKTTPHYNHTSACTLACPTGVTLQGNGQADCQNGSWANYDDDKCQSTDCSGAPGAVTGGTWNCTSPMTHGSQCMLNCNFGLQSGDGLAMCKNGQLTNDIVDVCDSASCPSDTFNYQGSTYRFTSKKLSWTGAQAEANTMGGYLAAITSQQEQDWITTTILNLPQTKNHEYWIGIYSPQTTWLWTSGAPVAYTNFESGGTAGQLNHYGMINEAYVASGVTTALGKWSAEDNGIDPQCGLVEIPKAVVCMCATPPPPADPSACAPPQCSTLTATNIYSFIMCTFDFAAEFGVGNYRETQPGYYTATTNGGEWKCMPAGTAQMATCP